MSDFNFTASRNGTCCGVVADLIIVSSHASTTPLMLPVVGPVVIGALISTFGMALGFTTCAVAGGIVLAGARLLSLAHRRTDPKF